MRLPLNRILTVALFLMPLLCATAYGYRAGSGPDDPVITPSPITFPCTPAGDSSFRLFTITNPSSEPKVIRSYDISRLPSAFRIARSRGRGDTVHPGRPFVDTIWFLPKDPGLHGGTFAVQFSRGSSAYVEVQGQASARAELIINAGVDSLRIPASGQPPVGEGCVQITNPSCRPLRLDNVSITGPGLFRIVPPPSFPIEVQPGTSATICFEFRAPDQAEHLESATFMQGSRRFTVKLMGHARPAPPIIPLQGRLLFGPALLGDTVLRILRVRNNSPRPDTLRAASLTGLNTTQFSVDTSVFPLVLRPNNADTGSIPLRFHPSRLDTQRAVVLLLHRPVDDEGVQVGLTGVGQLPEMQVEPRLIDMGDVPVLSTRAFADTIVLRNLSNRGLGYLPLTIFGPDSTAFTLTGPAGGGSIPPNDSVQFGVRFTPAVAGTFTARVQVEFIGGRQYQVGLRGRGTLPSRDMINVTPDSLGFPCTAVGDTSAIRYITVENNSAQDITIESATLSPRLGPFLFPEQFLGRVVRAATRERIAVEFSPGLPGTSSAVLDLFFRGGLTASVKLAGLGAARPEADVDQVVIDFGNVYVDSSTHDTLRLTNLSECRELVIDTITFSDDGFRTAPTLSYPFQIAGADRSPVPFTFTPADTGDYTADMNIMTAGGTKTVRLTGRGIRPSLRSLSDSLPFTETLRGSAGRWDTIKVVNDGNTNDTLLTGWSLEGVSPTTMFNVVMPSLPAPVRPLVDTVRIAVQFLPDTAGAHRATLLLPHGSGPHAGTLPVKISGDVVEAPGPRTALIDMGDVMRGDTVVLVDTLVLVNPTNAAVTVSTIPMLAGADTASFTLTAPATDVIPPQGMLAYTVRFVPAGLGTHAAEATVSFSNGTSAHVDFTGVGLPRAARRIRLDTLTSDVNVPFTMKVHIDPPFDDRDNVTHLKLTLRYKRKALYLKEIASTGGATDVVEVRDADTVMIERTFAAPATDETLLAMTMQGLVTGDAVNLLEVLGVEVNGLGSIGTAAPGLVNLIGCDIVHQVGFNRPVAVHTLYPMPAGNSLTLRYFAAEGTQPVARLIDATGSVAMEYPLPTGTGSDTEATLPLGAVGSGAYFLELRTRTVRTVVPVVITQ